MAKRSYAQVIILLIPAAFLAAYLGVCALARQVDLELPLWLKLWSSAFIAGMLHVVIMALVGALSVGVPIERISFGLGKRWFQTSVTGIPISFGLPFGGYVKFIGDESNFVGGEPNADPKLLGLRRCEVELSGCAVLLVCPSSSWGGTQALTCSRFGGKPLRGPYRPSIMRRFF